MSGSNSSAPGSAAPPPEALSFTVHSQPRPALEEERRTRSGRWQMLLVLAVCAAPVVASYFTYFVIRPQGRSTNYSELILPTRSLPDLPLVDLQGQPVKAASLRGQWLFVIVGGGACDALCEKNLYLQRQLREMAGREKDRIDKIWLVEDDAAIRSEVLQAIELGTPATVLRAPRAAITKWLEPAPGEALEAHLYIVDPMGEWMMRAPVAPNPNKLKSDVDKLLRASASWDTPGR